MYPDPKTPGQSWHMNDEGSEFTQALLAVPGWHMPFASQQLGAGQVLREHEGPPVSIALVSFAAS